MRNWCISCKGSGDSSPFWQFWRTVTCEACDGSGLLKLRGPKPHPPPAPPAPVYYPHAPSRSSREAPRTVRIVLGVVWLALVLIFTGLNGELYAQADGVCSNATTLRNRTCPPGAACSTKNAALSISEGDDSFENIADLCLASEEFDWWRRSGTTISPTTSTDQLALGGSTGSSATLRLSDHDTTEEIVFLKPSSGHDANASVDSIRVETGAGAVGFVVKGANVAIGRERDSGNSLITAGDIRSETNLISEERLYVGPGAFGAAQINLQGDTGNDLAIFKIDGGATVFTIDSAGDWLTENVDINFEGATDADLFFLDAANDRVGIGVNAPTQTLEVDGTTRVNGRLLTNQGSASSPSHSFSNDVDTGCYRPSADTYACATGGVERWSVDSSGDAALSGNIDVGGNVTGNDVPGVAVVFDLAAADDDFPLGAVEFARTVTAVGCHCSGTCSTPAEISLEDRAGNAMTHATVTCNTGTGATTFVAVTDANTLTAGEGLRFDVDNAVSPETDTYEIVFTWNAD